MQELLAQHYLFTRALSMDAERYSYIRVEKDYLGHGMGNIKKREASQAHSESSGRAGIGHISIA